MLTKDTLASVIIVAENNGDDEVFNVYKNVIEGTHKNLDVIVSSFRDEQDTKDLQARCAELKLDTRWVFHQPSSNFIKELTDLAEGEVVFYKTCNNILWYPRHISVHLDGFNSDKGAKWALSHTENRNIDAADSPFNTLSFRIDNPPKPDQITLDEICHIKGVETDWSQCIVDKDGTPLFYAGYSIKQWIQAKHRGTIPPEITIIQWSSPNGSQPTKGNLEELYGQVGVPVKTEIAEDVVETEDGIEVVRSFPTIVGNYYLREYSESILKVVQETEDVNSIAIKRTMGMGDVVLVEPIIRKLKSKFPNTPITLYTAKPEIVEFFKNKPDKVETIDGNELVKDYLGENAPEQVKIDLDLSYESRNNCQFIDAYAKVAGVEFDSQEDKHVELVCDDDRLVEDKYVVLVADGSGWPGKSWPMERYTEVVEYINSMGYKVFQPGFQHTENGEIEYRGCDLKTMVNLLSHCEFYVGTDNGPMHIARGLNKPCIALNGAALTYLSNPNRENIVYVENKVNGGYGVKHRTFFNMTESGITFVPVFEEDPSSGLNSIEVEDVKNSINKLFSEYNGKTYAMNIGGTLVKRDVAPGFIYYKDDDGNFHRERPFYHPDQRLNISQIYSEETSNLWKNNFEPVFKQIKEDGFDKDANILDAGCNMGIFINGMVSNGFTNVKGFDINRFSVEKGRDEYKNIAESIIIRDITKSLGKNEYDVILLSDVLSYVGRPEKLLQNTFDALKDNGVAYLNNISIENDSFRFDPRGWPAIGNGETITLYSKLGLEKMLDKIGFTFEDYGEWEDEQRGEMTFLKLRKKT